MKPTRLYPWLLIGLSSAAVACGAGASPEGTGGTGRGGVSASGGKNSSGGPNGSGGATGGQNSGGTAGNGAGSSGGTTGRAGANGTGGGPNSSGGQNAGGSVVSSATGGKASGGSTGSAGAPVGGSSGAGGVVTGGVLSAGGQGSGGVNVGGSTGFGGTATGGSSTGGKSTGGSAGNGGSTAGSGGRTTGGASVLGGSAAGGATGTGGKTGTSDYHPCPTDGTVCKIMPFGDSITDGYNQDTAGGYRVELFRLAHSAGKNITFVGSGYNGPDTVDGAPFPHNHEGHSGWTIAPAGGRSGISTLVSTAMPKYTPHIVLLMIGTNDAIDNYDMANAPTRLKALIDSIYALLPNVLIVVAQPIPSRGDASKGDDTALSDRIKTFNSTIPAVVKAQADAGRHILLVDMFTPFTPKASLLEDQWHPNLAGYVLLGSKWYSVLQPLL